MKERLDQLTLQQLIDLSCGERKVLLGKHEVATEEQMLHRAVRLINEFKSIASPAQAKMDMIEAEEMDKLRMKEKCVRMCLALCSQEKSEMARDVLIELDVSEDLLKDDKSIRIRCKAMLDEVQYEIKRLEERNEEKSIRKNQSPAEIRKTWYSEIAWVMSTLKMPVDMATNAAIYANLVHQASERSKALAKMPSMMGMFM